MHRPGGGRRGGRRGYANISRQTNPREFGVSKGKGAEEVGHLQVEDAAVEVAELLELADDEAEDDELELELEAEVAMVVAAVEGEAVVPEPEAVVPEPEADAVPEPESWKLGL